MSASAGIVRESFGATAEGAPVDRFLLTGAGGMEVAILDYGGRLQCLSVPDRAGELADVLLGYDDIAGYEDDPAYHGALVGRYANRIRQGTFTLDGYRYLLAINNGPNHLHGGLRGFDRVIWDASPFEREGGVGVELEYLSPDGEEGYPGSLRVRVTYTVTPANALAVEYHATTDRATPVNLTQHAYFNLAGAGRGDVLDHELTIDADAYTPLDADLVPTGALEPVEGTPLDFRTPHLVGERIGADFEQLRLAGGYDQNFVLRHPGTGPAATLYHPASGRLLEVSTTEPGIQLYTGNFLDGRAGKRGLPYPGQSGLCLETQHFADSPNIPAFPSTILRPGEELRSRTEFAFSTRA
jgi:aldose 1-epimerase